MENCSVNLIQSISYSTRLVEIERKVIQWPNYINSIIETEQQIGLPVADRITLLKGINLYENFDTD